MSAVPTSTGWRADLQLRYEARGEQTFLAHREHIGPLRVQRPFYPEPGRAQSGTCHTYIVHPPGGVVGGDELNVGVAVGEGASVLLTTPAATKYYRSDGRVAQQTQRISVAAARFEWLPQESIFHGGARVRSRTRFDLSVHSQFIGWEIPCLGLPARSELFDSGKLDLDLELWVAAQPVFIDRLRIDGELVARAAACDLGGHHAIGTLLAYPADRAMLDQVRAIETQQVQLAATLVDGVLMCRALGTQAEHVKHAFIAIWQNLRPVILGCKATLPRIWAT
jgi:urease accessory protein